MSTANYWSVGEIPAQPEPGTAVADRDGVVWIRASGADGWLRAGMFLVGGMPWSRLLLDHGPLVRLVPAVETSTGPELDEYGNDHGDDPRIAGVEWERDHGGDR